MSCLTHEKEDLIFNAIAVGMTLSDAYVYAGLTPTEIGHISEDEESQVRFSQWSKQHEFSLLSRLHRISDKQEKLGKADATTWMLEKMYPRYSSKPTNEMPTINLHLDTDSARILEHTEIHKG